VVPQDVVRHGEGAARHEKADHPAVVGEIAALVEVGRLRCGQVGIPQCRNSIAVHAGVDEFVFTGATGQRADAVESVVPGLIDRGAPQAAIAGEEHGEACQRA